jgi:hypothetical protein
MELTVERALLIEACLLWKAREDTRPITELQKYMILSLLINVCISRFYGA